MQALGCPGSVAITGRRCCCCCCCFCFCRFCCCCWWWWCPGSVAITGRRSDRRLNMCCGWNFELKCCCWFVLLMIFRYFRILAYSVYVFFGSQCMVFLSDTGPNGRRRWSWLHPPTWPSCPASRMLPLQGDSYIEHIFTGNNLIEHKFQLLLKLYFYFQEFCKLLSHFRSWKSAASVASGFLLKKNTSRPWQMDVLWN